MMGSVRSVLKWLGILAGSLSVMTLFRYGFDQGLSATFGVILSYYDRLLDYSFGWSEPLLQNILSKIGDWFQLKLQLYSHWKHLLVMMWLYFGGVARTAWQVAARATAIFYVFWGGAVALVVCIAAGTVPLDFTKSGVNNAIVAGLPALGIVLFELGRSCWAAVWRRADGQSFSNAFWEHSLTFNVAFALISAAVLVSYLATASSNFWLITQHPGILLLFTLIIGLAIYYLIVGMLHPDDKLATDNNRTIMQFRLLGSRSLGVYIIAVIFGAFLFAVMNAGLSLLGL